MCQTNPIRAWGAVPSGTKRAKQTRFARPDRNRWGKPHPTRGAIAPNKPNSGRGCSYRRDRMCETNPIPPCGPADWVPGRGKCVKQSQFGSGSTRQQGPMASDRPSWPPPGREWWEQSCETKPIPPTGSKPRIAVRGDSIADGGQTHRLGPARAGCAKQTQFCRSARAPEGEMRKTNPIGRACRAKQSQWAGAKRAKQSQFEEELQV